MRPHFFILLTIQFNVRYFLRSKIIVRLLKFADVSVILFWKDITLEKELKDLGCNLIFNYENLRTPTYIYLIRAIKNILHFQKNIDQNSFRIEEKNILLMGGEKSVDNFQNKLYGIIIKLFCKLPYIDTVMDLFFPFIMKDNSDYLNIEKLLKKNRCTHLISATPYLIQECLFLYAAKRNNIHTIASVLSFDNIVSRNDFSIKFDNYFVWNQYNKDEIIDIYKISENKIDIIGPVQFDFYYNEKNLIDEYQWRNGLNIPKNRKIILFAGGYVDVAPNEQDWLKKIDEWISKGEIKHNPIILFRIHPVDPINRWESVLNESNNIIFFQPWKTENKWKGQVNISMSDIKNLCSTLKWTDVHINTSSTMTVDGAIFDKPQIGPAFDDVGNKIFDKNIKSLYDRVHFRPITNSGGLTLAKNDQELVESINDALDRPIRLSKQRAKLVKEICYFNDGKSAERFIKKIKSIIS